MKKYMLLLPSAIYPYIFVSSALLDRRWGTKIFNGILPIIFIAGLLCNIIVMTKAIREKWDARELLQVNRILKWVQLPGNLLFFLYYFIAIFLLSQIISLSKGGEPGSFKSLIEGLGIAFLWIVIFILVLNLAGVLLSGFISIAAIVRAKSEGLITGKSAVFCGICSFLVVADVVTAQILYSRGKRERTKSGVPGSRVQSSDGVEKGENCKTGAEQDGE